ncbi:hypothetical protein [Veillonella sp. oral taxon 780]|uniref:hypothetical protein n=1 Tax=Veillonella sp. oral taxon 780 TaxID=671229 RepID=UPI00021A37E9|nr:hypothetical protein [Veillonella sp. oral taxon 780]EGS34663.1 hypothetical protein HMPREF9200_1238 [Veillonella sp. oral taxon 780 str. F0422]
MDDNNKTTVIPTIIQPSTDSTVTDNSSPENISEGLSNPDTTVDTTTEALSTLENESKVYTEEDFYFDEDEVLDRDRGSSFNFKKLAYLQLFL